MDALIQTSLLRNFLLYFLILLGLTTSHIQASCIHLRSTIYEEPKVPRIGLAIWEDNLLTCGGTNTVNSGAPKDLPFDGFRCKEDYGVSIDKDWVLVYSKGDRRETFNLKTGGNKVNALTGGEKIVWEEWRGCEEGKGF